MKRRELLGTLSVGGIALSSGCLSRASEAVEYSPSSRFGVLIENHLTTPQSLKISIKTRMFEQDVFSSELHVTAAEDAPGSRYHPEVVYRKDILPNLRSLTAVIDYNGETFTYSWRVTCNHLYVRFHTNEYPGFGTISPKRWEKMIADS
ncbi:hypothetical protein [Halalkaliarchaeum desulfuricum]|uniref:hypothetical protein n=1 Tax=Halalkaliarchaeum desulfuricum TaxID=2055893 RepID=UPI000E6C91E4|nr:hypothetical protein [Halalkaliarchaeum desulfuricum]